VDWLPPTNDGYSEISSYNLQWDSGTDGETWSNLIGFNTESLALTFTVASSLTQGDHYRFKVRAKNYWGWSDFSEELEIKSATYPDQMAAVTTEVDAATGGVSISWEEPYDNEQPITAYEILISNADGSEWLADLTNCDASQSAQVTARSCLIPMSVLITDPYNYQFRDRIEVQARAYNSYGWATEYSPANTEGATVRVIPA
jgi:hypothetical protein